MKNKVEKFSQKHIYTFSILVFLIVMLMGWVQWDDKPAMGWDMIISRFIISAATIGMIRLLSLISIDAFGIKGLAYGLVYGLPLLVLGISSSVFSNLGTNFDAIQLAPPCAMIIFTASMFMVGACEELVYRGLLLNNALKKWGNHKKGVYKAVLVCSIMFGVVLLINLTVAPVLTVIVQTVNAASAGIMFSAIYIRCRNIWAVVIVHALVDWLALFVEQCMPATGSIISGVFSIPQALLVILVGSVVPLVFGLVLLRKVNFEYGA